MASVTVCSDFGAQENKVCHSFHFFPTYCHKVMGPDAMILAFWMLRFKPAFSPSSKGSLVLLCFLPLGLATWKIVWEVLMLRSWFLSLSSIRNAFCRNGWFQVKGRECSRLDWNILACWKAKMCSKMKGTSGKDMGIGLKGLPLVKPGPV